MGASDCVLSVCLLEVRGPCPCVWEAPEGLCQGQRMAGPGPRASFASSLRGQALGGGAVCARWGAISGLSPAWKQQGEVLSFSGPV